MAAEKKRKVRFAEEPGLGFLPGGGLNVVSAMPRGLKMRSETKRSNGMPLTRATISASRKKLILITTDVRLTS
jgi:hypothetical protein